MQLHIESDVLEATCIAHIDLYSSTVVGCAQAGLEVLKTA